MPENEHHDDERTIRPFGDVLREIRRGDLHDELGIALQDVVEGVLASGKPGALTLKLTVKPGDARGTVTVKDDLAEKIPVDKDAAVFYVAPGGVLQRRDPNQPPLWGDRDGGPRPVERPANVDEHGEIKETGA